MSHNGFPRSLALLGAAAMFMEILDATIVVTALPAMAADLGVAPLDATSVVTAYLMTLAVVVPLSGWAAGRWGIRPVFLTAMVVFTVGSLGAALAPGLGWLVAMRVLQAAGGAMMVPVGRLAVLRAVERPDLVRAMAYLTWPALVAPVVAPLLGGLIVTYAGWRMIFAINIPVGVVGLGVAAYVLRSVHDAQIRRRLDVPGVVLTATAVGATMLAAHELTSGRADLVVLGVAAGTGVVAGVAARNRMRNATAPLLDLAPLRHRSFASVLGYGTLYRAVISAVPFLLPLMFQLSFGWSPAAAGAMLTALFVGNLLIKPFTTGLMRRFGIRRVLVVDTLASVVGFLALGLLDPRMSAAVIAGVLVVSGALRSVGFSAYNTLAFADVPAEEMADANALHAAAQELGAAVGIAAGAAAVSLGSVLGASVLGSWGRFDFAGGPYTFAFAVLAAVTLLIGWGSVRLGQTAGDVAVGRS